jgi:hypothetical protein
MEAVVRNDARVSRLDHHQFDLSLDGAIAAND